MNADRELRAGGAFLRTSALLVAARLGGAALGVGTQIGLAWVLPPSELGVFFLATSFAAAAGTAAALGYPSIAVRFLVRYAEREEPLAASAFVRCARRDAMLVAGAVTAAALVGFLLWAVAGSSAGLAMAAAALAIPAIALMRVNGGLANAWRLFHTASLPDLLLRPLLLLVGIAVCFAVGQLSGVSLALSFSAAAILATLVQAVAVKPFAPRTRDLPRIPRRLARYWRASARPMVVVTLFTALFADVSIILAGSVLTPQYLAPFAICVKLGFLVGFVVQVAHGIAAPDIAAAYSSRGRGQIVPAVRRANGLAVAATAFALVASLLAGDRILGLFGAGYGAARDCLTLIVASQLIRALFGPSIAILTVVGAQRQVAAVAAATLALLSGFMASLVPIWGAAGAALAVLVATTLSSISLAILLHRTTGLRTDIVVLLRPDPKTLVRPSWR